MCVCVCVCVCTHIENICSPPLYQLTKLRKKLPYLPNNIILNKIFASFHISNAKIKSNATFQTHQYVTKYLHLTI